MFVQSFHEVMQIDRSVPRWLRQSFFRAERKSTFVAYIQKTYLFHKHGQSLRVQGSHMGWISIEILRKHPQGSGVRRLDKNSAAWAQPAQTKLQNGFQRISVQMLEKMRSKDTSQQIRFQGH